MTCTLKSLIIAAVAFLTLAADTTPDKNDASIVHPDILKVHDYENVIGAADAPVTLVAYINFDCAYCREFESQILPKLKKEFVDNEKLKVVYRVFPMTNSLAGDGMLRAELAECSAAYGHFWEVTRTLFDHQGEDFWKNYKQWIDHSAASVSDELQSCIAFHKARHHVIKNQQRFAAHEIVMTPTIFINGKKLVGARPYNEYRNMVAAMLPSQGK